MRFFVFGLLFFVSLSSAFSQSECNLGFDGNGDGLADCAGGVGCTFPANIEEGCNCADGIDNDGNGQTDINDAGCANFYGLGFVGEDESCDGFDSGSGGGSAFDFVGEPATSGQNTVDTQSKVAIGDMNCDGIPDVVTTSKWNQTIRIVATSDNQPDGSDKGDVIQDFKTPGAKIFPKGNFFFELEILIADIDGSCPVEVFSVVSKRKNANSEPDGYYLVGFSANASPSNSDLVPLFDAVLLGSERPGSLGIADFDCDGESEIFVKDKIYDAATGELLADGNGGDWNTDVNSAPIVADIIPGGNLEMVSGNIIYSVPDLTNGSTQNLSVVADMNTLGFDQWFPKQIFDANEYGFTNFSSTSVADVNNDGNLDIVLSGALNAIDGATAIFFWDVTNNTVSSFLPVDPVYADGWPWGTSRPNLGDIDGDGQLEITFVAGDQLIALEVDAGGNLVQKWTRTINDSRSGIISTTVYDFDNDGSPELVYRDSQQLVVIDGETGQNVIWSVPCQSHTMTEGPLIADVDGDGSTDLCATCNFGNSFDINDPIQQQALGELRCYFSEDNSWLPTRQVWNQQGYSVVNIADDLSVPCPAFDMTAEFVGDCDNDGTDEINRPLNTFMNQVPTFGRDGCPFFPAPDISFVGNDPNLEPGDPGYVDPSDPNYFPAVNVIPPICGDLGITVDFNIINSGQLTISSDLPVSFWEGNPTLATDTLTGEPAVLLHTTNLLLAGLAVGDTLSQFGEIFDYSGETSTLYIVLNDEGLEFPVDLTSNEFAECFIDNNIYAYPIVPLPFDVSIEKISDNTNCDAGFGGIDDGELRAVVTRNGVELTDLSPFAFEWFAGSDTTAAVVPAGQGGDTDRISALGVGDYTLVVTNTEKGCASAPVTETVIQTAQAPDAVIQINSQQTICSPPNGELEVIVNGDLTGVTFDWRDEFANSLGITGPVASDLEEGSYAVNVEKNGCVLQLQATLTGPVEPDVNGIVLQNIESCTTTNSGEVTAEALLTGVVQDPNEYTFEWYFYDNVAGVRGSLLPPEFGSGPTRTGLDAGFYSVIAINNASDCESANEAIVEIIDSRVFPDVVIQEVAPQTSCDPSQPNGILEAVISNGGVVDDPANYTIEWFSADNTDPSNQVTDPSRLSNNDSQVSEVGGGGVPYTVRVSNANGCSNQTNFVISTNVQDPILTLTKVSDNNICDPALASSNFTGAFSATVEYDGVAVTLPDPNYEFTLYEGTSTGGTQLAVTGDPDFTELDGGFYTVQVEATNLFCQSTPQVIEILDTSNDPILVETITPNTRCNDDGTGYNGALEITTIDGAPANLTDYVVNWSDGNVAKATPDQSNSLTYQLLEGDLNYTVEVINLNTGCSTVVTYLVPDNSVRPTLALAMTPNSVCDEAFATGTYNGSVTATLTDPNNGPNPVYSWTDLTNGTDLSAETGSTISNVQGGTYEVTVSTDLGCSSDPVQILVTEDEVLPALTENITPNTRCNDDGLGYNGELALTDIDGSPADLTNYIVNWSIGNVAKATPDQANSLSFTGLEGDLNYTVEVINRNTGCINTETYFVPDNSTKPILALAQTPNTVCDETLASLAFNGGVTAVITDPNAGANPVYTWTDLSNGSDLSTFTGNSITNVPGGTYSVTVSTDLGCTSDPVQITVAETKVFPLITLEETPETTCSGTPNGALEVTFVDGLPPSDPSFNYTINWYNGVSVTITPDLANTALYDQINGGFIYTVEVINNVTGCVSTESVTLPDNSALPIATFNTTTNTICDPGLTNPAQDYTGSITLNSLTDPNGTTHTYSWTDLSGSIDLSGNTSENVLNLPGGTYEVIISNELGCISDPLQVIVPETLVQPAPSIVDNIDQINCSGTAASGALEVDADGALTVTGFQFEWFVGGNTNIPFVDGTDGTITGSNGQRIENLVAGTYTARVTNLSTGCRSIISDIINESITLPSLVFEAMNPSNICDDSDPSINHNGDIEVNIDPDDTGPQPVLDLTALGANEWFFVWYAGSSASGTPIATIDASTIGANNVPVLDGLAPGFYTVVAENSLTGCDANPLTIEVTQTTVDPTITTDFVEQTSCDYSSNPNGEMQVIVDGPIGNTFEVRWYSGTDISDATSLITTNTNVATGVAITDDGAGYPQGNYTVVVFDETSGCQIQETIFITQNIVNPIVTLSPTDPTDCTFDGYIEPNLIQGANVEYQFRWYAGESTSDPLIYDVTTTFGSGDDILSTVNLTAFNGGTATLLRSGFYTLEVIDINNLCSINTLTTSLGTPPSQLNISFVVNERPTDCTQAEGVLTAYVDLNASGTLDPGEADYSQFDYEWYNGLPSDPSSNYYSNNPPVFTGGPIAVDPNLRWDDGDIIGAEGTDYFQSTNNGDPSETNGATIFDQLSGDYTVVITDPNGCKEFSSFFLPFSEAQNTVSVKTSDDTKCSPVAGNGSIEVDIQDDFGRSSSLSQYIIELYDIQNPNLGTDAPIEIIERGGYVSDFAIDEHGWLPIRGLIDAPNNEQGGPFAIKFHPNSQAGIHLLYQDVFVPGHRYNVSLDVFIPEFQADGITPQSSGVDGLRLLDFQLGVGSSLISNNDLSANLDNWVTVTFANYLAIRNQLALQMYNYDLATGNLPGTNDTDDDRIYIRNIIIEDLTVTESIFDNLEGGDYAVTTVQDNTAGCYSQLIPVEIREIARPPLITPSITHDTFCDNSGGIGDGEIALTIAKDPLDEASDPPNTEPDPRTYDIVWSTAATASANGATTATISGLAPGIYTATVTDTNTGCVNTIDAEVIDQDVNPAISNFTLTPSTFCTPNENGAIAIDANDIQPQAGAPDLADYAFNLYLDGTSAGNLLVDGTDYNSSSAGSVITFNDLVPGDYFVEVQIIDNALPGFGCISPPIDAGEILDNSSDPTIIFNEIPNNSCDPANLNGQLEATADLGSPTLGFGDYTFEWFEGLDTSIPNTNGLESVAANVGTLDQLSVDLSANGTYTVRVTDPESNCVATATYTISDNKEQPQIDGVTVTSEQTACDAGANGEITVTSMTIGVPADYDFKWYDSEANLNADNPIIGETSAVLSNQPAGVYYVVGVKRAGAASGALCETPPVSREIIDQTVLPTLALTPQVETSCQLGFFEGAITIVANTASGPGAGATYTYDITGAKGFSGSFTGDGDGDATDGDDDVIPNLEDDTYTITATNNITTCSVVGVVTIQEVQQPIIIQSVNSTQQFACDATLGGGTITVTDVTPFDVDNTGITDLSLEYSFEWREGGSDYNSATIRPETGAILADLPEGTYYVKAIRNDNTPPGSGCESAPIRVDIIDNSVDPTVDFTTSDNQACDLTGATGVINIEADAGLAGASSYTYNWNTAVDPDGNAIPLPVPNTQSLATQTPPPYTGLQPGTYNITVTNDDTGCTIDGTVTVDDDPINPVLLAVTPVPQTDCDMPFNGRVEIDESDLQLSDGTAISFADVTLELFNDADGTSNTGIVPTISGTTLTFDEVGEGTYYVFMTFNTAGIGFLCESTPFRVDVTDDHVDPVASLSTTSNQSCDITQPTGTLRVQMDVGLTPASSYAHEWQVYTDPAGVVDNSVLPADNLAASDDETYIDLPPGTYEIQVTNNDTGCFTTATTTIDDDPINPVVLSATPVPQTDCSAPFNGQIIINESDLQLSDGTSVTIGQVTIDLFLDGDGTLPAAGTRTINATDVTFSELEAGSYFVFVSFDNVGPGFMCESTPFVVDVIDNRDYPILTFDQPLPDITCDPAGGGPVTSGTGELVVNSDQPATFVWTADLDGDGVFGEPGDDDIPGAPVPVDDASRLFSTFSDLVEGTYQVEATGDITGCATISQMNITRDPSQSNPNVLEVFKDLTTTCVGNGTLRVTRISIGNPTDPNNPNVPSIVDEANGAADITMLDNDYTYQWYKTSPTAGNEVGNTREITGLDEGSYFVVVTSNLTNCISLPKQEDMTPENIIYPEVSISQPLPQIGCMAPFTGELEAVARETDGTIGTYTFDWLYEGATTLPAVPVNAGNISTLSQLPVGRYDVTVTNTVTGCTATALFIIQDDSPDFIPVINTGTEPVTNCNNPNGVIFGVARPFTDANGIDLYPLLPYDYTIDIYSGDLSATLDETSGPGDLASMSGVNAGVNVNAANVTVGPYTVRIIDNNTGCYSVKVDEVRNQQVIPDIVIIEDNPLINCDPARPNGQLSASADGGLVGGYEFTWYEGQTASGTILSSSDRLIGVGAGTYTVEVLNVLSGCSNTQSGVITDGTLPAPTPTPELVNNRENCVNPDGRLRVSVGGEVAGYDFRWYEGPTGQDPVIGTSYNLINLDIGTYSAVAVDVVTGCESAPAPIDVGDERLLPEFNITTEGSSCDFATGALFLEVANDTEVAGVEWYVYDETAPDNKGAFIGTGTDLLGVPAATYVAEGITFESCVGQEVATVETVVANYNLVSSNGDGINDNFQIDCITQFPNNNVKIYTRTGILVYQEDGYNNADKSFIGIGEDGSYPFGDELPNGTYYYVIDKGDGSKLISGFLELIR